MGGAYEYEEIGRSKRLERRRAAVGLGAFFVVVGTLGWNRERLTRREQSIRPKISRIDFDGDRAREF